MKVFLNRYRGDFAMKAKPRARFAIATKALPSRVVHVVADATAVWTHDWNKPARFKRLAAEMSCGSRLASVTLHAEPPTDFELCTYCVAAEIGLNPAAPLRLGRLSAIELERAERMIGLPAARLMRRARLEIVAGDVA